MRELYFGFYKNISYKDLLYVSLAELILRDIGCFKKGRLVIHNDHYFTKAEKHILHKVNLHSNGILFFSELENWYREIQNHFIENDYIRKYPLFGYCFTDSYKKDIKYHINHYFDYNIVKFINSCKIEYLKPVINNIEEVLIPIGNKLNNHAWTYYYYDKTEMTNEVLSHRRGIFDYMEKRKGIKYKIP